MKRVWLLFLILINVFSFSYGQRSDSTWTVELKNITINENRFNIPFSESSRDFDVITSAELERIPVQSIPEVLTYTPGIDIRQRGPVGVQADIGIRGGTFEQTLVLINGIKMSDPQTGHHSLNLPLNLNSIKRVEILKGPAARVFGQNAFSGAVNFITQVPDKMELSVNGYGGDFGLYGGSLSLALPNSDYKQYISIARDASDGYRYNTDFTINNFFYQSEINAFGGTLNLLGGYTDRKFGANGFYASPDYEDQYEEIKTGFASVSYQKVSEKYKVEPRIYWRINNDHYFFFRNNPGVYQNDHTTHVLGAEINSSVENSLGKTGFGIEYRKEMIHGDWVRNDERTKSNLDGFSRIKLGIYSEHRFRFFDKLDITPGIYINYYNDFKWNAFPGIDVGYSFNSFLRAYANVGKTYRIPTFYDQYYQSPKEKGSTELNPEVAKGYELGLRYIKKGMNMEVNYFKQDADQIIDWVWHDTSDSTGFWQAQNLNNIATEGIELSFGLDLNEVFHTKFPVSTLFASYNYIDADKKIAEGVLSRYKIDNLQQQLILGIDHQVLFNVRHHLKGRMLQRVDQKTYWVWDSRLYWKNNDVTLYVETTNISDTDYTEIMTPMPGRWFRAGIEYNIGL